VIIHKNGEFDEHALLLEWKQRKNGSLPQASVLTFRDVFYFKPNILKDQTISISEKIKLKLEKLLETHKE
jgi:hypothetical protein